MASVSEFVPIVYVPKVCPASMIAGFCTNLCGDREREREVGLKTRIGE